MANGLKQMEKLVDSLIQRQDSGPFRDPVNYRELGLFDYPDIVKRPMCLTDVKRNLAEGSYRTVAECADDVRLIWDNCMLYNQDGSDFYNLANKFKTRFEDKFARVASTDVAADDKEDQAPTLEEKKNFAHNIYKIKSEELGEVVTKLDQCCPSALDKKHDKEEIEINIDAIEARTFHQLDRMVREFLPESLKKSKKKKATAADLGAPGKRAKT